MYGSNNNDNITQKRQQKTLVNKMPSNLVLSIESVKDCNKTKIKQKINR